MSRRLSRSLAGTLALVVAAFAAALGGSAPAAASGNHTQINGSGSSWAANAVNQWIADVSKAYGYQVSFTSTGSAQGRKDFAYKTTDFGVSDIAYQGTDPITGDVDSSLGRPYAYLPIVAGGTSFPYNLSVAGQRVRNLRLSGQTLAKIFTNRITYWDDPQIKSDNNGKLALPHIPIIPVVHSEGSGSTYQFTAYLAKQQGSIWTPFNRNRDLPTEYFPRQGAQVAQNGSDGVINFITSAAGAGTIGFDEYSYALGANFPVAKVLNSNGYFTAPTQYNDAVALTMAQINMNKSDPNYLTQDLSNVYTNPDPRTYPLSSYSYMIIPTGASGTETKTNTTAQRQTIADFLYYSICPGQAEMGPIGYSPLPLTLVRAGFEQIAKLKAADPNVDLSNRNPTTCNNPTFDPANLQKNKLAEIAPLPPACDHTGQGPCNGAAGLSNGNPVGNQAPGANSSGNGSGNGSANGSGSGGTVAKGGSGGTGSSSASASAHVDPNTGQLVFGDAGDNNAGGGDANPQPTSLAAENSPAGLGGVLYTLMFLLLLAVISVPVLLSRYWASHATRPPGPGR